MIRILMYLTQVVLLVLAAVWIADRPGSVTFKWMGYEVTAHIGLFLFALFLLISVSVLLFRLISGVLGLPRIFGRYGRTVRREKGYDALTQGLVALASGDSRTLHKQSERAVRYLEDGHPLALLLSAHAARSQGKLVESRRAFEKLTENKQAAMLGIRGLLQDAQDAGDLPRALFLARQALSRYPRNVSLLKTVYALELRDRDWNAAEETLEKLASNKGFEKDRIRSERIAFLLLRAQQDEEEDRPEEAFGKLKKAWKLDPVFVPTVLAFAKAYIWKKKPKRAAALIERAWKHEPHPELAALWSTLAPAPKPSDPGTRLRWFDRLSEFKPDSAEGFLAAGKAAMDATLWGEARVRFQKAESIHPSARLYRLFARLEELSAHNAQAAETWREKADSALPDRVWVCRQTGRLYETWSPVAEPDGGFNTIVWGHPEQDRFDTSFLSAFPAEAIGEPEALRNLPKGNGF